MTPDHDLERVLDRWFAEGPTQMPDRFLAETLGRIDHAPRPRRLAGLRAGMPAIHPDIRFATVAAVVVAVVGAGLLVRPGDVGGPLAGSGLLPESGQSEWRSVGPRMHPTPSGVDRPTDLDIVINPTTITIFEWHGDVHNSASVVGGDRLDLRMLDNPEVSWPKDGGTVLVPVWPCHVGDAGTYTTRLSPDGRLLTFIPVSEACAARATILAGDWVLTDLGDLQPGRHEALDFRPFGGSTGRLAYTVPAGWTGVAMLDGQFALARPTQADQAAIRLFSSAYPSAQDDCGVNRGADGVGRTPAALAAWLKSLPGLVVSTPSGVTIGGLSGIAIDLAVVQGWTPTCATTGIYTLSASGAENGGWSTRLWLNGTDRARYVFLDRGDGTSLVLAIEAPGAVWDAFLTDAASVIDSFEFTR